MLILYVPNNQVAVSRHHQSAHDLICNWRQTSIQLQTAPIPSSPHA